MPFCPYCGVRNEKSGEICLNCGGSLIVTNQGRIKDFPKPSDRAAQKALSGQAGVTGEESLPPRQVHAESGQLARIDSQLGKGTITPNAVELGSDGYHFKYDEPAPPLAKTEPAKEKTIEFRVTDLEMNPPHEPAPVISAGTEELAREPEINKENQEPAQEKESLPLNMVATTDAPSTDTPDLPGENPAGEMISADLAGPEFIPEEPPVADTEILLGEPEPVETHSPAPKPVHRVIWEGRGCILGIPFGPRYQITEQLIRINDPPNGTTEYPLGKITVLKVRQNWLGRLCGSGDLVATVREMSGDVNLSLRGIPNPAKVLRLIADSSGSGYNIKYG